MLAEQQLTSIVMYSNFIFEYHVLFGVAAIFRLPCVGLQEIFEVRSSFVFDSKKVRLILVRN
jgi:hypothetical protein